MSEEIINILSGPPQEVMFEKLRLWNEGKEPCLTLTAKTSDKFKTTRRISLTVKIARIEYEDRSANIWKLKLADSAANFGAPFLYGYYNSLKRTGNLRLDLQ